VPAAEKEAVTAAIADAKKVLEKESGDAGALRKAAQDLQKASYKIAEALYKTAAPPAGGAAEGAAPGGPAEARGEDVIDAEVVEEKK
jgi:molecular chaperone DnaK